MTDNHASSLASNASWDANKLAKEGSTEEIRKLASAVEDLADAVKSLASKV